MKKLLFLPIIILFGVMCSVVEEIKEIEKPSTIPPVTPPLNSDTNLPIVIIDTMGEAIPDEPKVKAYMKIISNPHTKSEFWTELTKDDTKITNHTPVELPNSVLEKAKEYDGIIGIEIRGHTSQRNSKKQYAIETRDVNGENLNVSIFGMPKENDWILHSLVEVDRYSLMRDPLGLDLFRMLGHYSPRTQYCEVFINGIYRGVYSWMEKIKGDKNRVDISKLTTDENNITGGYIVKLDSFTGSETEFWTSPYGIKYQYHYPKPSKMTAPQKKYIQNEVDEFEQFMKNDPPDLTEKIKLDSWVDYLIVNELVYDMDAYCISGFFYKDKLEGKLAYGPVWDFGRAFGRYAEWYSIGLPDSGWTVSSQGGGGIWCRRRNVFWWSVVWEHPQFRERFTTRWKALRTEIFTEENILSIIEGYQSLIKEAAEREFASDPSLLSSSTGWEERVVDTSTSPLDG